MSQYPPQMYPPGAYGMPPGQRKGNAPAVISLILGILGCVPFLTGLLAVVLGFVGIRKTRDPMVGGKGMAIAGLVLGLVSLVCWTLFGGGLWAYLVTTKPMRDVARQYVVDLASSNPAQAQSRCTADISKKECEQLSKFLGNLGSFKDTTVFATETKIQNGVTTAVVTGLVELTNGKKVFSVSLIKQNDQWKVQGVEFKDPSN